VPEQPAGVRRHLGLVVRLKEVAREGLAQPGL
jgi:hypothetical protein